MKGIVLGLGWQGPVSKQPLGKDAGFLGYVEETEPAEDLEPLICGRGISDSDLFTHNIRGDEIEGRPTRLPPIPSNRLRRSDYEIAARAHGEVSDDAGLDIRCGGHASGPLLPTLH